MKKFFLLVLLAIAGSWCVLSDAMCVAKAPQATQQQVTLNGILILTGVPCDEEPCMDCITLAFETEDKEYYLSSDNDNVFAQLGEIEANLKPNTSATITGIPYQQGNYTYINVQTIIQAPYRLPSFCDEWNMIRESMDPYFPKPFLFSYRLTTDTVIAERLYAKLEKEMLGVITYEGALREGTNRDIYYIPAGSTYEFLLCAFNAQVGDVLTNLWIGGRLEDYQSYAPEGFTAEVIEINDKTPRIFYLDVQEGDFYTFIDCLSWMENIGSDDGPNGGDFLPCTPVCPTPYILCAYQNGETFYMSPTATKHGCDYSLDNELVSASSSSASAKILRDGQLFIVHENGTYNAQGIKVE